MQQPGKGWKDRPWRGGPQLCYVCQQYTFRGKNSCDNKACTINTGMPMHTVDPEVQEFVSMFKKMKSEAEAEVQQEHAASISKGKKRNMGPEGEEHERMLKVPRNPGEEDGGKEVDVKDGGGVKPAKGLG